MSTSVKKSQSSQYVVGKTEDIRKHYQFGNKIGQAGQFGYAMRVKHIQSGEKRAVKVISKARFKLSGHQEFHFRQLRAEIEVMSKMDHPNIIKFFDVFENETELYIVMELCKGGELFDRIKEVGSYSEASASGILRMICEGIQYMHSQNIAHCDLKPDNFLFVSPEKDSALKIIDFGMSKFVRSRKYFRSLCGTPYYVAPEVLMGQYNHHSDMWSFGVIMFVMLFGYPPFYADQEHYGSMCDQRIFALVKKGFDPKTRPGYGAHFPADIPISDSAKDLISKLLTRDVAKRLTATEALNHAWLRGETATSDSLVPTVVDNLKGFTANTKFKTKCLQMMVDSLSDTEISDLKATFEAMDENKDGIITVQELQNALKYMGEEAKNVERIFSTADLNGDGQLSYEELLLTAVNRKIMAKEERLWDTFRKLDLDGDGMITKEEIEQVLGKEDAEELLAEADANDDGLISYDEFISIWTSKQGQ